MPRRPSLLVLGGSGLVGSAFVESAGGEFAVSAPTHAEIDLLDPASVLARLRATRPDVVLNLAAWTDVDGAERQRGNEQGPAYRLNVGAVRHLAEACADSGAHLIHVSTDYVFDGTKESCPYVEGDPTGALSWYGQTKEQGEHAALALGERASVVRIEMPFTGRAGPKADFPRLCVERLRGGQPIVGVTDQRITPVLVSDVVLALATIASQRMSGVFHVASSTWTSPFDFARAIARALRLDANAIVPDSFEHFQTQRPAPRPRYSWLDVGRYLSLTHPGALHTIEDAVALFARAVTS